MVNENNDKVPAKSERDEVERQEKTPPSESTEFTTDAPSQRRVEQKVAAEPVPQGGEDGGSAEVTEKMNESLEKGFVGHVPDETPNENYTVEGVTTGAPRPDAQEEPLSPGERT